MTNDLDLVSIVIPCRDEQKYIGQCLDSIVANEYPKDKLEVFVIDGRSDDGTRQIVERYAQQYPFIKILDNPKKITPAALNIGIKHAGGELIIRIDAHAAYEKDYISKCVKYLEEYEADTVGGVMKALPRDNTPFSKAIVHSLSNRFGVGGSVFRTGSEKPEWVDTVFGGCYRREVFDKIGLFNEDLTRTQDMEFNLRLIRAGGKILLHPEIVSYYYARSEFKSFCRHNFGNGVWAIYPFKFITSTPVSWRHLVPLVFVSSLIGSAVLSIFSQIFLWLFVFIFGSYALANLYFSAKITVREKDFRLLFVMPLVFAALHIGYGLGSLWGLLKVIVSTQFWKNRLWFFSRIFK